MLDIKSDCTVKMSEIGKAKEKGKTESEAIIPTQTTCEPSIDSTRNQAAVTMFPEVVPAQGIMSEAEARQHIETIKLRFDDITALLLELDDRRGWEALKYKSMHQMIQAELKDHLNKSVSQIYRKLTDAKIRRELSQICEKVSAIPAYKLEPLSKLPPEQWQDTWQEVASTATEYGVTREHVQVIVSLRLQSQKQVADFQEPIKVLAPRPYKVGEIVMIQLRSEAKQEQRKHSGCWGIVSSVLDSKVILAVGGELVQYPPENLNRVENSSPTWRDACDRVTRLWSVPNLPSSVQLLLSKFYQRELIFTQGDLDVLQAIERLYQ